ncbi:archaeosortase/exosortase family protein [Streptomyces sp. NPDC093982]|uniref:archaeosortase/exosortase family protein n=1 Tax=Streptomyces sp. NPDC093982 TaxID=3155077 RepID=UPI003419E2A6
MAGPPQVPVIGPESSEVSRPPYLRIALTASFVLAAAALYAFNGWFRSVEAAAGEHSIGLITDGNTHTIWDEAVTLFGLGTQHAMGLRITAGCSSALLIVPLLLVGAGFMISRRSTVVRILAGTGIGAAVLVVTNQLRLCLIAWFSQQWGHEGFGWAHTVLGSLLSLVGVAASVIVLLLVAMRRQEPGEPSNGAPA